MKRPRTWLRITVLIIAVIAAAEYAALAWLAPRYVTRLVEQFTGSTLTIGRTQLTFPLTTTLTDLRLSGNTPQAALTLQQVVIRPRWVSFPRRTVWLESVDVDHAYVRLYRTAAGTLVWPSLATLLPAAPPGRWRARGGWRVRIDSLKLTDAVVEFVDEKPSQPFRGLLDHLSLVMGPVTIPSRGPHTSFALRGELLGLSGDAAPLSCSGWTAVDDRNLEAACQLDAMPLKAFEPYYQGQAEVRVYDVTLKSTSQWVARSNDFTGRIQLEFGNLREGDLSVHGRTLIDVKQLVKASGQSSLRGEVTITGPLDLPSLWRTQLMSSEEQIQQLVTRLKERGVKAVKLSLLGPHAWLNLVPATEGTAAEIEAAGKEMQEALDLLASPPPAPVAAGPESAAASAPAAPSAPMSSAAPTAAPAVPTTVVKPTTPPVAPPTPPTPQKSTPPERPPVAEPTSAGEPVPAPATPAAVSGGEAASPSPAPAPALPAH